ncbi:small secreted [Cordyceps militaris]|uniref:Small secreted n=1 Tax=Cordyceps militaris TaxID=73501 RepID=A0A2H4S6S9_CORMI|nr:small secreted [Cordyceps militaris]
MQFFKTLFAMAVAATVSAAPLEAREADWIIQNLSRDCDSQDSSCTWSFAINNQLTEPTACTYVVNAGNGQPASRSNGGPSRCGDYTITSGWSGQFAVGFTTFSVRDHIKNLIAYPAYNDDELAAGNVADKSFRVEVPKL